MRLEPLYRVRFSYPDGWVVGLEGGWEQHDDDATILVEWRGYGRDLVWEPIPE